MGSGQADGVKVALQLRSEISRSVVQTLFSGQVSVVTMCARCRPHISMYSGEKAIVSPIRHHVLVPNAHNTTKNKKYKSYVLSRPCCQNRAILSSSIIALQVHACSRSATLSTRVREGFTPETDTLPAQAIEYTASPQPLCTIIRPHLLTVPEGPSSAARRVPVASDACRHPLHRSS